MTCQNRGQIRIIEAFLAVLIVFSSFAVSSNLSLTQNIKRHEDLASVGLQALTALDSDGILGRYIDEKDWTALREALTAILSPTVCFNLTVYDDQFKQVNTVLISNGGFNSQQIAFVEYVCASHNVVFGCYVIHLLLAVVT